MKDAGDPRWAVRPATSADAAAVAACVDEAYAPYVARMGTRPGPMLDDYAETIACHQVSVVEIAGRVVGVLVLVVTDEGLLLDNVAVAPEFQGGGIGRALLEVAESEAVRQGYPELVLYTHELMTENLAMYRALGYTEYARRVEKGFPRVYLRKRLGGRGTP